MRVCEYYVYILASHSRRLYVGVTNDIARRITRHRAGAFGGHTARYRIHKLRPLRGLWMTPNPLTAR